MFLHTSPSLVQPSLHLLQPHTSAAQAAGDRLRMAQQWLLEPSGLTQTHLFAVLQTLMQPGVDEADLYFQYTRAQSWALEESMVKTGSFHIDQGVGVRTVRGDKTAFAYSDDIALPSLQAAAEVVRGMGSMGQTHGRGIKVSPTRASRRRQPGNKAMAGAHHLYDAFDPIDTLSSEDKVALLGRMETLARAADPRVIQVMASIAAEMDVVLVARTSRHHPPVFAADVRPLVRVSLQIIVEQNGRRESGSSGAGGRIGFALFDDAQLADLVRQAVEAATTNLEARPAPAGEMDVVLGNGWPGVLLHEAVGHGLEGDFNRKGSSAFSGRMGQQVAAKGVTVLDDGTLAGRRGSLNIDDEGLPTQCNVLIENGKLTGYLQDGMNARLMHVSPTGNARRESYAAIPMPRMTNTYMLSGDKDPQEIVASLKRGIYATHFGGGQVDITSGKFVFSASLAWWVEGGKLKYPVKGATLMGSGPESLKRVAMVGKDLALDHGVGVCGKDGQSVPVGVGQPTLRINRMVVGGTA